ncbi:MAG: ABC transporter permease, partial [Thermoanaerobaculia bacterium]|nr:ABC transporter permease [Thermoanaerobaculia bacterium]
TVAIFSLVNTVLLRPLPYPEAQQLSGVRHAAPGLELEEMPLSPGLYLHYLEGQRSFASLGVYNPTELSVLVGDVPERVEGCRITGSLFDALQVPPALGRHFVAGDGEPGAAPVAVLSHALWQRRFGADPKAVGETVTVEGESHEIVGVMPPGFSFPFADTEIWLPLAIDPANAPVGAFFARGVGRLREGVTREMATEDLASLVASLADRRSDDPAVRILLDAGLAPVVTDRREDVVGNVRAPLVIVLGAVAAIFVIACANVTNLFLVRAEDRQVETSIRLALGATRGTIVASFLAESVLLATAAGAAGWALAVAAGRILVHDAPANLPRLEEHELDGRVLIFAIAVSLLGALFFGLLPGLRAASRGRAVGAPEAALRSTSGRERRRVGSSLVIAQVALALLLLVSSGLSVLSYRRLAAVAPGFTSSGLLTFDLSLPPRDYAEDDDRFRFHDRLRRELAALPGVTTSAVASTTPLGGNINGTGHAIEDFPLAEGGVPPVLFTQRVSSEYFTTFEIPLLEGRVFDAVEEREGRPVVLVSESIARQFWEDGSAIGKRIRAGARPTEEEDWYTIVGVVGDVRDRDLHEEPSPIVYHPLRTPDGHGGVPTAVSFAATSPTMSRLVLYKILLAIVSAAW